MVCGLAAADPGPESLAEGSEVEQICPDCRTLPTSATGLRQLRSFTHSGPYGFKQGEPSAVPFRHTHVDLLDCMGHVQCHQLLVIVICTLESPLFYSRNNAQAESLENVQFNSI